MLEEGTFDFNVLLNEASAALPPPTPPAPINFADLLSEAEQSAVFPAAQAEATATEGPRPLPSIPLPPPPSQLPLAEKGGMLPPPGTAGGVPQLLPPPPPTHAEQLLQGAHEIQQRNLDGIPVLPLPPTEQLYVRPPVVPPLTRTVEEDPFDLAMREQIKIDPFAVQVAEALERAVPSSGRVLQSHQIPPRSHDDPTSQVKGWVMMAGRNAGKSYAGARWLHRMCNVPGKPKRARIIAPSFGDAVASCVEGPSGLLEASNNQAKWKPSHPGGAQVQWPNGSVCYVIGTPTPRDVDRLRAIGNIDYDWFEEAAANPQLKEAERQARLSRRRLGSKWICTTTPKPLVEIRQWKKDSEGPNATIAISSATAFDNPYADPLWLEELETMYAGTLLYQQEVLGKVLEDIAGAIWNQARLERSRVFVSNGQTQYEAIEAAGFQIQKVAVGVDPANSSGLTGIVAVALALKPSPIEGGKATRHLLVLEDCSTSGMSAETWASEAVRLALKYNANIIAENDSGGDAIRAVLKAADHLDRVTIQGARARGRGSKEVRAEPVALLWERDDFRGHMVGSSMERLEEQMTTWVPDDKSTAGPTGSPDRVDALVWACTYLWTRSGAEDIEMHIPGAAPGTPRTNPLQTRPGQMAPWSRARRHRKDPANVTAEG